MDKVGAELSRKDQEDLSVVPLLTSVLFSYWWLGSSGTVKMRGVILNTPFCQGVHFRTATQRRQGRDWEFLCFCIAVVFFSVKLVSMSLWTVYRAWYDEYHPRVLHLFCQSQKFFDFFRKVFLFVFCNFVLVYFTIPYNIFSFFIKKKKSLLSQDSVIDTGTTPVPPRRHRISTYRFVHPTPPTGPYPSD